MDIAFLRNMILACGLLSVVLLSIVFWMLWQIRESQKKLTREWRRLVNRGYFEYEEEEVEVG